MMAFWEWVDTFGGPVALYLLAYGIFLFGVLWAWHRTRTPDEVCERCGGTWKITGNGNAYHFCSPNRDKAYP